MGQEPHALVNQNSTVPNNCFDLILISKVDMLISMLVLHMKSFSVSVIGYRHCLGLVGSVAASCLVCECELGKRADEDPFGTHRF